MLPITLNILPAINYFMVPRDPIHLNRAGYEAFAEGILNYLKPQS